MWATAYVRIFCVVKTINSQAYCTPRNVEFYSERACFRGITFCISMAGHQKLCAFLVRVESRPANLLW